MISNIRRFERALMTLLLLVVVPVASKEIARPQLRSDVACSFFPPNNLRYPIRPNGQMTQPTFDRIVQIVQQVYAPLFQRAGRAPLKISSRWTDDSVNAFAFQCNDPSQLGTPGYPPECNAGVTSMSGRYFPLSIVVLFGGLARSPEMTAEGLVLVACHEMGHHLAGYPRYGNNTEWASAEGQSDYFATAKCARQVFGALGQNAVWASRNTLIPLDVRVQCQASFPQNPEDAAICMRSSMGGMSLARVLATARGTDVRLLNFAKPDPNRVAATFEGHPEAQCRLDTYFAGSICQVSALEAFSPTDSRLGACTPQRVQSRGSRPLCWFAGR